MSAIVRIGSLMKVGFGSAGVEIIRNTLQKSHNNDTGTLRLNYKGSKVSCIFLFCDIRSFTDATECLQEEVFVFTNQIAAVVHSICNSYGGSVNKNIGDAFLVSWRLDDGSCEENSSFSGVATRNQAEKALLSVVKICIALHHDEFYVKMLSNHATDTLLKKLKDRKGPTVQLGFGLHAGKAVEGAIGSQRKIDATYVSMAVEKAEYLESSTKKYKVPMLMSDSFHRLLKRSKKRCRMVDRVMFKDEGENLNGQGRLMDLFTYDIDVDAIFDDTESEDNSDDDNEAELGESITRLSSIRRNLSKSIMSLSRRNFAGPSPRNSFESVRSMQSTRLSMSGHSKGGENQIFTAAIAAATAKVRLSPALNREPSESQIRPKRKRKKKESHKLVLPSGPALYSEKIWFQADMRRIRQRYTTDMFNEFNLGLKKYYSKQWGEAKLHFESVLAIFEDGPSSYFLAEIIRHKGIPPSAFQPYGKP